MPKSTLFWTAALAAALAAGVTVYAGTPDPERLPSHGNVLSAAGPEAAEMQQRRNMIATRMAYKELLIEGLVERRLHLDQVAREFLKCMEGDETAINVLRLSYKGCGDEARAAQNVLDYIHSQPIEAGELAATLAHYEAEYRRLYPCD